jgi:hypothetical protein
LSFSLGSNLDELPGSDLYPPWRYRLRTSMKYGFELGSGKTANSELNSRLKSDPLLSGVAEKFDELFRLIQSEVANISDVQLLDSNALLKIAYTEVDLLLPGAWNYVESTVSSAGIGWTSCIPEIPALVHYLKLMVPPSEVRQTGQLSGSAATLSAIAIATWLSELAREMNDKASDTDLADYRRSCRLLLKSFEDSELKRSFLQLRTKVSGS